MAGVAVVKGDVAGWALSPRSRAGGGCLDLRQLGISQVMPATGIVRAARLMGRPGRRAVYHAARRGSAKLAGVNCPPCSVPVDRVEVAAWSRRQAAGALRP